MVRSAPSDKKSKSGWYILALFIFCTFAAGALYYINLTSNALHKQSTIAMQNMQQKTHAINNISQNLRSRSYTLLSMLNEKDPFVLDELNQSLYHEAALFRTNRDTLRSLELTVEETRLFNSLLQLTAANSKNQVAVANLLIDDDKKAAATLLFDKAIPNQSPMIIAIRDFVLLVESDNAITLNALQTHVNKNQNASFILTVLLSAFAIALISLLISSLKSGDNILARRKIISDNVIESALDAIVLTNDDGLITVFNKSASKLLGYSLKDVKNQPIELFLPVHINRLVKQSKNTSAKQPGIQYEDVAQHKNKTAIPVHISISDTAVHGTYRFSIMIHDLSASKEHERRIQEKTLELDEARARYKELSETDPLTKIPNRRAYEDRLNDEVNSAKRSKQALGMIIFDIDCFKEYNDYYGHDVGDVILKRIASVISSTLPRSTDFVARFGGEEFVVLLPSTDTFGAYQVAERIRLNIKALDIKHEKSKTEKVVTISAGVSAMSGDALNDVDLFKQADSSLYSAKANGKNRTNTFKAHNKANLN